MSDYDLQANTIINDLQARLAAAEAERDIEHAARKTAERAVETLQDECDALREEVGPVTVGTRERCKTHDEYFKPSKGCPWCKLDDAEKARDKAYDAAQIKAKEVRGLQAIVDKQEKMLAGEQLWCISPEGGVERAEKVAGRYYNRPYSKTSKLLSFDQVFVTRDAAESAKEQKP